MALRGLERIRFTTSHPKDLSLELIQCFNKLDKLCHHIHLPVQSGSDAILKRMNRRYKRQAYIEKVDQLRSLCPDIAITSDIIVGFPGESEVDFDNTLTLIQEVGFDGLFAFIYSDRPNAPAAQFSGKVDDADKKARLHKVLACQEKFTHLKNNELVGAIQEVLVDGPNKNCLDTAQSDQEQWTGRTASNKIVHFPQPSTADSGKHILTGKILKIMIEKALPHCLIGRNAPPMEEQKPVGKGDRSHAA